MSRALNPSYNGPIRPEITLESLREDLRKWMRESRADEEKSGEIDTAAYHEGQANAFSDVLLYLIGKPYEEVEADLIKKIERAPEGVTYEEAQAWIDAQP